MPDLTTLQSSQSVSIVGTDSAGLETNAVNADSNGNLFVRELSSGPAAPGTAATNSLLGGGQFNTTLPTLTNTQQAALQVNSNGLLRVDGSGATQPVSGTVTANIGTAGTLALESSQAKLTITPGTALGTNTLTMIGGSVTTAAPTYTTGQISPLSLDTGGALRVTGSITASNPSVSSTGAAPPASATYMGGSVTTAPPAYTTGQMSALSLTTGGLLRTTDSSSVPQGTSIAGLTGQLILGSVTTAAPAYTSSQVSPLSLNTSGAIRVDGSGVTQPVAGLAAAGVAPVGNPNLIAGTDGAAVRTLLTDANGRQIVIGAGATGTSASSNPVLIAGSDGTNLRNLNTDTTGRLVVSPVDGQNRTYSASFTGLVMAAAATDLVRISGSATATIRIKKIEISGQATAAGVFNLNIVKRSTANTGGTSTTAVNVPYDSSDAAGTATVVGYTVNPTAVGTAVGNVRASKISVVAATGNVTAYDWEFGVRQTRALVLRGVAEGVCINMVGQTIAGNNFNVFIEWSEE